MAVLDGRGRRVQHMIFEKVTGILPICPAPLEAPAYAISDSQI